ncbi:MAG: 16S rRNA (cytidine(1402)-2'-O)-methyltransferase [Elusimicrobia bacterium]|jgi:16S rRNA (cytidine1402-2'-O)-methyltransferase|nr:16S rRNA (cytidine(1402)-2'-O)-methyltransferase [Elusimicrobiota bacterium]
MKYRFLTLTESKGENKGESKGKLYIVATPIGNLEDVTLRAINILKEVDLIISEDTRTTAKLLARYSITKKVKSYYSPREYEQAARYLEMTQKGKDIALLSENGTPAISDPGYEIINRARNEGIEVIPVPGPSAFVAALSVCGLPADEIFFAGFVPRKKGERKRYLEKHINENYTFVFYDSKYRIRDTVDYINEINSEKMIFIGREMTKKFEEYIRAKAEDMARLLRKKTNIKGEFVVVCYG